MSQWHFHNPANKQRIGPLDEQAARAVVQANPNLLAWREGMSEWKPVSSIPELGGITGPSIPPTKPAKPAQGNYGCGTLVVGLIVLLVVATCWNANRNGSSPISTSSSTSRPPVPVESPEQKQARATGVMDDAKVAASTRLASAQSLLKDFPSSPDAERAKALIPELEEKVKEEREAIRKANIGKQWRYFSNEDSMSGKSSKSASVTSSNSFAFDFPYQGTQKATLSIRRHPRHGNDVIFSIERGQILCHSYGECRVRVRFDDEQARTFKGNEPADNSTEYVFIPGYNNFVQKLSKAKIVRVEVDVYRQGALVAEFNVEGFDPAKLK